MHKLPLNVYKFHYDLKFAFWNFHTILTATNYEPTGRPHHVIVDNNC